MAKNEVKMKMKHELIPDQVRNDKPLIEARMRNQ